MNEIDDKDGFKQYVDHLRSTLPFVEYERQEPICLPPLTLLDTNWAARELGDMLTTLSRTHKIYRFRELRLSLVYLTSGYELLLYFLGFASIGTLILDGYGQFRTYEASVGDSILSTATNFLLAIVPSSDINEIAMQGIPTGVPANVIANVLAQRTLSILHLDEVKYTSAAEIAIISNAFRFNSGLRALYLDVSSAESNACISQIVRCLPATLERLTVELPLAETHALQSIVSALSELLSKESLQMLILRHFDFRDLSLDGFDFCHLPRLSLEYCGFAANSAEQFTQAARNVQTLSLHGTKFGGTNHLLYHTLSSLTQLEELRLEVVHYPNLSPLSLFRSFNKSSLRSLQIGRCALSVLLPHICLLERLESLEILCTHRTTPFSMKDVRKALRRNRSLLVITIDGQSAFQGYCRRNRGLRTKLSPTQLHLLPRALQQVGPCHDAATWTARALLDFSWNETS